MKNLTESQSQSVMEAHSNRVRLNNTEQSLKANDFLIDALLKRLKPNHENKEQ